MQLPIVVIKNMINADSNIIEGEKTTLIFLITLTNKDINGAIIKSSGNRP